MSAPRHVGAHMTPSPVTVDRSTSLAEALRLMEQRGFRHLPVVEGKKLVGLVSKRELLVVENMHGVDSALCAVSDFLLDAPYSVGPEAPLCDVARAMHERKIGSAVVVEGGEVVGVFTTTDALRVLAEALDEHEKR
jgi:acetoin utilization protein AcuB